MLQSREVAPRVGALRAVVDRGARSESSLIRSCWRCGGSLVAKGRGRRGFLRRTRRGNRDFSRGDQFRRREWRGGVVGLFGAFRFWRFSEWSSFGRHPLRTPVLQGWCVGSLRGLFGGSGAGRAWWDSALRAVVGASGRARRLLQERRARKKRGGGRKLE